MTIFRTDDAAGEPKVYGAEPGRPFFADLVGALLRHCEGELERLPGIRIYVPSRRAARALKQAFADQAPGGVVLLPKITATADLDEEDMPPARFDRGATPPAPSAAAKRAKLAAIYQEVMAAEGRPIGWAGALRAAGELSRTSDLFTEHGVGTEAVATLEASAEIEEGAEHWQSLVRILRIMTERYPAWLEERGMIDGRKRRAALLTDLVERLREEKPRLVIAAGFLGTAPSSVAFLAAVAKLPSGAVVLPGFDFTMGEEAWEAIEAPHPQHVFRCLLKEAFGGIGRAEVRQLGAKGSACPPNPARAALLSLALTPAEATADWAQAFAAFRTAHDAERALEGLGYAKAGTTEEEADFIAIALRGVLEEEGKTAFLVTADRLLARRVASRLRGWGIEIDDSGGTPLRGSYRATFLRLVARLMGRPADAAALAGVTGHQLFGLGLASEERRRLVRAFDLYLRGRNPREGWDGLERSVRDAWRPFGPEREGGEQIAERTSVLLRLLREAFRAGGAVEGGRQPTANLLRRHLAITEALAATDQETGEERLYRFEDGEALAHHLGELLRLGDLLGEVDAEGYGEVFDALLEGPAVRPPGGQHPRLAIYGLLEARLQTADLVVIGGLQEGVWPVEAPVDPFVSRGMRRLLGLPAPELDIGRVAHDFLDLASKPRVLLTRSTRAGRTPARASRLMLRLESFLGVIDEPGRHDDAPRLRSLARQRFGWTERPEPASRPSPRAPVELYPRRMSISTLSTWRRDPYEIFARHILQLKPLDRYAEAFSHRDRGKVLHDLLERFVRDHGDCASEQIEAKLEELLTDALDVHDMPCVQRQLNAKFLGEGIAKFAAFETRARDGWQVEALEKDGEWTSSFGGIELTITGRVDRIDRAEDGTFHIIDYKKGGSATMKEDKNYSPQLFLTALMLEGGGFASIPAGQASQVSFVRLTGSDKGSVFDAKDKNNVYLRGEVLAGELESFRAIFAEWLREEFSGTRGFTSQEHPHKDDPDGPYDWLARRGEWARQGGHE